MPPLSQNFVILKSGASLEGWTSSSGSRRIIEFQSENCFRSRQKSQPYINYCPQVCFLDVSVSEGEKAQKSFDEKYGSGKAVFLKCDVSKKDELHGTYISLYCTNMHFM